MNISDMLKLDGKVALVTGASKGLGHAFALALANAGANLVITCRHPEQLASLAEQITQYGRKVLPVSCDISNSSDVSALTEKITEEFGRCDILVNNAGAMRCNKSPQNTSLEEWLSVIHPNINGTFLVCREIASHFMIPCNGGKIVNIASTAGLKVLKHFHGGSYEVSKAALIQLTKALATEWAPYSINVNTVAPGYYDTQPNRDFFAGNRELYEKVLADIPLKRLGNTDELAALVVCLCSNITDFMTGSVIVMDGGYCVW